MTNLELRPLSLLPPTTRLHQTLTQQVCDANLQAGKGQQPAVVRLRLGSSWGQTAMKDLVLFGFPQRAALQLLEVWA